MSTSKRRCRTMHPWCYFLRNSRGTSRTLSQVWHRPTFQLLPRNMGSLSALACNKRKSLRMARRFASTVMKFQISQVYNSNVLIDDEGNIVAVYHKVFPCCPDPFGVKPSPFAENVNPGTSPLVLDTKLGRIGFATCFDANFPELWQGLSALGADLILWPSAYAGGMPLSAYSMLYHYQIVANGIGLVFDPVGQLASDLKQVSPKLWMATVDLDSAVLHDNFQNDKIAQLLHASRNRIIHTMADVTVM
mmetsp:Transcript_75401/g.177025  ORF Transcript_75401/g.177025 Transcript_75401/m.177025 type:complete len:248 (+) Transcript_75401:331-1074(+)